MTIAIGEKIKSFQLKNVDGSIVSSEDLTSNAKATVIIFSCNHCPYVLAWEDRMVNFGKTYQAKGTPFALINANDAVNYPADSFSEMVKRAKEQAYPFPYLHDESQEVARSYGASKTPEVFVFDSMGLLRYHGRIDDSYDDPNAVRSHDLREALEAVLAGEEPKTTKTVPVGCTIKWR